MTIYSFQLKSEVHTPRLPVELIREIIGIAAMQSRFAPSNLALVCKETNLWMMPIIFRTITLDLMQESKRHLMKAIADNTRSLASHVRDLHIVFAGELSSSKVVSSASNVESYNEVASLALNQWAKVERLVLTYWDTNDSLDKLANIETFSGLWDFRIIPSSYLHPIRQFNFPYLRNVTHFYYGYEDFCFGRGKLLSALLPNVTHLAFCVSNFRWRPRNHAHVISEDAISETLELWLSRPLLRLIHIKYQIWEWGRRFNENRDLDPPAVWDRIFAIKDERFRVVPGSSDEFESVTGYGSKVWDWIGKDLRDWREIARRRELPVIVAM